MRVEQILEGKPFMTEFGIVGYSSVVLVVDGEKNILFDCGARGCALQLKEGLAKAGICVDDITDVVISHMHFDHVGNLPLFRNAQIHISETEWKNVCNSPDEWHCVQTREYIKQRGGLHFVKEGDYLAESVKVLELPGHTYGLIGLKCGQDILLCSDAIKNRYEMWEEMKLMAVDEALSKKTMERIRMEAQYIYTGHDTRLNTKEQINKEAVHFDIRFANGTVHSV